ncbi:MAG: hypothetical protein EHM28_01090 [Spirochaetaceae bacterium]|nr:MAG: hypothetical protein EHM28_01090 [Spirochaetaceae bacterium]
MKRFSILLSILLAMSQQAQAFDFGLIIDNTTTLEATDVNNLFFQKDKGTLWMNFDISDTAFFAIQGNGTFVLQEPYFTYGFDQAELTMDFPVIGQSSFLFGFTAGRFYVSDFTGFVLTHNMDGARLVYKNPWLNSYIAVGFTGFLFKADSTILMSIEDKNYEPSFLPLAPPRLIGLMEFNFPEVFAYQTLDISIVGQLDMHSTDMVKDEGDTAWDISNGGKIDTLYAGIGLQGQLAENFFYESFFIFETGRTLASQESVTPGNRVYTYVPIYAFMGGFKLSLFFPEFLASELTLTAVGSSGDADYETYLEGNYDDYSIQFSPISRPTIGLVFPQQMTNLIIVELEYSMKPFSGAVGTIWEKYQMLFQAIGYFRSSLSDISNSEGLNSGSEDYYLGTEVDFINNFKPFADLGMSLALGVFLPNNYTEDSAFTPDSKGIDFTVRFQLSFEI